MSCDNFLAVMGNVTVARRLFHSMPANETAKYLIDYGVSSVDELVATLHDMAVSGRFDCGGERKQHYPITTALRLYLPPVIIVIGTVGNILSLLILRQKAMRALSTYFYLTVLAMVDTAVLYLGLLPLWLGIMMGYERDGVLASSPFVCKTFNALSSTASDFSVWLIVVVTVERYVVVCHPLHASAICRTRYARIITCILCTVLLCINAHFFWTVDVHYYWRTADVTERLCDGGEAYNGFLDNVWSWVDAAIYSLAPFVAISILNGFIIRCVILSHRDRLALNDPDVIPIPRSRPAALMTTSMTTSALTSSSETGARLTLMLLAVSCAFLVTTLPMIAVNVVSAIRGRASRDEFSVFFLARTVAQMLMFVNHSINFFLYCATGHKFRRRLLVLLHCRSQNSLRRDKFLAGSEMSHTTHVSLTSSVRSNVHYSAVGGVTSLTASRRRQKTPAVRLSKRQSALVDT